MARLRVYVDAFNVYYGGLKDRGPGFKWLDLEALVRRCVPGHQIDGIVYCTARVADPAANARQDAYLRALDSRGVDIVEGQYKLRTKRGKLIRPTPPATWPPIVEISAPEEKGSDVNLASCLLIDAFQNRYEQAVVMSLDTDLVLPIRFVNLDLRRPIGLLYNQTRITDGQARRVRVPANLRKAVKFVRSYRDADVQASQFPDPVVTNQGAKIAKPQHW